MKLPSKRQASTLAKASAVALCVGWLAATTAVARPHDRRCHGDHSFGQLEGRIEALGLAPDQREGVYAILDQARAEKRALRTELRAAHERMRELLEQEAPDLEQILAQADSLGALETEAHKAKLRTLLDLRGALTPEQWEALRGERDDARGRGPRRRP